MKTQIAFLLLIIGMSACAPQPARFQEQIPPSSLPLLDSSISLSTDTVTATAQTADNIPELSLTAAITPTPDLRIPPERWHEWPIVPEISQRAREIYQRGIRLGRNPRAFSKIGDCQSIPASFLGIYDTDRYSFTSDYQYLQESVNHFSGSFNREGESVRGGFNTASVLLPFWANAAVCKSGENPMVCENRIHNPSMVFISLEVWFEGRTPDVYENYMRRIIEYNIEQGTLPILATKADNVEGDHSINYTLAKLAYEYDIPLWNFWRAVQPLPNHGLDPGDSTGFHINLDGWNMRSFSALQALDSVRRAVTDLPAAETATPTPTPTIAVSVSFKAQPLENLPNVSLQAWHESPAITAPKILFGLWTYDGSKQQSAGIFSGGLDAKNWTMLAESETTLLDYSQHGLLVAQEMRLYAIKGDKSQLLSTQLLVGSPQPAAWLVDGRVAAILQNGEAYQVGVINTFDESIKFLPVATSAPYQIFPSLNPELVYWGIGQCTQAECEIGTILASSPDDGNFQTIPYSGQPAFALDGKMAFLNYNSLGKNQVTLVDGEKTYTTQIPGNRLVNAVWSPDGGTLAVNVARVSDYSGRIVHSWLYFVSPQVLDGVLAVADESFERMAWSPNGKSILVVRRPTRGAYLLNFSVLDSLYQIENQMFGFTLASESYAMPAPIFWLP